MADWIEVNGVALRYDLSGHGASTLVLVHEMGGTIESWNAVLPALAKDRRVLRYDTRGAGLSEKVRGALAIDTMADDVRALIDALGMSGRVSIAGIAVGAAIAIHFAASYPERAAALIAMGPAAGMPAERRPATFALAEKTERDGMRASMDDTMTRSYPDALRDDMPRYERVRMQRLGNDPSSYAAIYRMLATMDMNADFARVTCPTLVLAGKLDGLRPPDTVEPIARAIPGARFKVLETAHFMAAQTPEIVAAAMTAFLDEAGA